MSIYFSRFFKFRQIAKNEAPFDSHVCDVPRSVFKAPSVLRQKIYAKRRLGNPYAYINEYSSAPKKRSLLYIIKIYVVDFAGCAFLIYHDVDFLRAYCRERTYTLMTYRVSLEYKNTFSV